jgi:protocatechuate 3,4-dioxygenase beta subunit
MTRSFPPRDLNWHAPPLTPDYKSSRLRSPNHKRLEMPVTMGEHSGPVFRNDILGPLDHDLIHNFADSDQAAIGPRVIVHGRVIDEFGRPVSGALLEVWQANAGGRYRHKKESYLAALDPNFGGCGRVMTDENGAYKFLTIRPGPYPWPNGPNDWRPAHIHFSLFGHSFAQRLITQMYFESDPTIPLCPIVQTIPDPAGIDQLTAKLDMDATVPMDSMAYRFDIVLRGANQTPFENQPEGL